MDETFFSVIMSEQSNHSLISQLFFRLTEQAGLLEQVAFTKPMQSDPTYGSSKMTQFRDHRRDNRRRSSFSFSTDNSSSQESQLEVE